mmetsp:Transcript_28890/g.61001  ORF Transcript_28890/g.61001 Transcript_28890/m.61001 type:complete len:284 (-) Transcript_28890:229-1080(-)|eukprot:CAMPEP_0183741342 /NCGR_PEP_ID=MMETSP0737-20130205/61884_1 /TAXON_ID=385413 /ORGANISM="Thalassiosira miniscula, Strain CCMP1093" /LENGTH=283 /DNA_ID=CAMNT_0025976647 /DNA_START=53 /DNA_END=904 /DNA_ORIENTATION=+
MSGLIPVYDADVLREIHELPTFLPPDENEETIRSILYVAGIITVVQCCIYAVVKSWKNSPKGQELSVDTMKISYQLTNLLVNFTLGVVGIYFQSRIPWRESITNKIAGYEHAMILAIGQIGYQIWALPIGLLFVGEAKEMLLHHVAVIGVASVSAFLRCGFRYYVPYFYGVIEISSVPLSVMNQFKNNKHWIKAYPELFGMVKMAFALSFLLVRVVLWTPFYWSFFANASMLLYSSENATTIVILALFNLSSLVLTFLQYYWATKVISAVMNAVRGGERKEKK